MRIRAVLFMSVLAAAVLGAGAGGASGATLFTSTAHTARVAVGTVASAAGTNIRLTSGSATIEFCESSTLTLSLVQNNDNKLIGAIGSTGANTFSACAPIASVTPTFTGTSTPWTLTVDGNGVVSGTRTTWTATVDSVSVDFGGGNYRGNLENVTAWQPTATGSPICLEFDASGTLIGPLTGNGRVDGQYCFEGGAAAFSLTN
jgi:hypothetical protein